MLWKHDEATREMAVINYAVKPAWLERFYHLKFRVSKTIIFEQIWFVC